MISKSPASPVQLHAPAPEAQFSTPRVGTAATTRQVPTRGRPRSVPHLPARALSSRKRGLMARVREAVLVSREVTSTLRPRAWGSFSPRGSLIITTSLGPQVTCAFGFSAFPSHGRNELPPPHHVSPPPNGPPFRGLFTESPLGYSKSGLPLATKLREKRLLL